MEKKYSVYDMWFSDHAGRKIKALLQAEELMGGTRDFYESNVMPDWERNIEKYKRAAERVEGEAIQVCSIKDTDYPVMLKEIYDPPYLLYYKGTLPKKESRTCAIVGSRKATSYGRKMAYEIGKILGEHRVWVISGMAMGADSCGHKGCMDGGGKTLAVLGSGVDICTPASNKRLMEEIIDSGGCVLSEFLPGTPGYPSNYPKRNRIISGISENIIVTEADERSGTSVTANMALEQGRDVFALPGNITSAMSRGTNRLIKEGAIPLLSVEDIMFEMDLEPRLRKKTFTLLGDEEQKVVNILNEAGEVSMDELIELSKKSSADLLGIVTVLEIKGVVLKNNGKITVAK